MFIFHEPWNWIASVFVLVAGITFDALREEARKRKEDK